MRTAELTKISGQKPAMCRARRSVANFKLREGMPIGCKVTLRRQRMYEFLDRLVNIALPRVRDFRGVSPKSFDGRGNYALGVKEQIIFPEINYDEVEETRGHGHRHLHDGAGPTRRRKALLAGFNMPFSEADGARLAHGKEERRREEQPPSQDGGPVRRASAGAEGDRAGPRAGSRGALRGDDRSWPSCRATAPRCGCATAAR